MNSAELSELTFLLDFPFRRPFLANDEVKLNFSSNGEQAKSMNFFLLTRWCASVREFFSAAFRSIRQHSRKKCEQTSQLVRVVYILIRYFASQSTDRPASRVLSADDFLPLVLSILTRD